MTAHPHLRQSAIPTAVAALLKTLHEAGFSAYPVGGCVRDLLLGRQPHDWDVTTNALPRQSEELLQSCRVIRRASSGVNCAPSKRKARESP